MPLNDGEGKPLKLWLRLRGVERTLARLSLLMLRSSSPKRARGERGDTKFPDGVRLSELRRAKSLEAGNSELVVSLLSAS